MTRSFIVLCLLLAGCVPKPGATYAFRSLVDDNAYATYWDHQIGQLKPGFKADLVVVDRDLLTMPAAEIDRATIRLSVVGGNVVYRAR